MATLVDSNVLLDVLTEDPVWFSWSISAMAETAEVGDLVINPLVYAAVSIRFSQVEDLDDALADLRREPLPWTAGFLAGKAFANHLRRGGSRRSVHPDFYIGAHAAVAGHTLLTRDSARMRTYFPGVRLISP
jgi:predicted nucleic acid-binding protein